MIASIFLRLFVYGVPIILVILGIIALIGGEFAETIFETTISLNILGLILVVGGILIITFILRFGIR